MYLSEHPLDEYSIVLTNLCNTKCQEINRDSDKEQLSKKETITFGGIVTNVVEKFSQKTGKPFGLVTIEDYDGAGEIALFGDDWIKWSGSLKNDYTVFITAKCKQKYRNSNSYDFRIEKVEQLYDIKDRNIEKFTLTIDASDFDETMATELLSVIETNDKGVDFYLQLKDPNPQNTVMLKSANKVFVNRNFILFIESNDKLCYSVN